MSDFILFIVQLLCRHEWRHHIGELQHFDTCGNEGSGVLMKVECPKCDKVDYLDV